MKYLFITYGIEGWRGVQTRGLRIAEKFNRKEVVFWNGYDSEFIKKSGFSVENRDMGFTDPDSIEFLPNLRAVIFADLPTNELANFAIFLAAKKKNIPIFILDNIYRRKQIAEGVFKYFLNNCEKLFLNGPSSFQTEAKSVLIVPPLITYKAKGDEREKLIQKFNIPINDFIILGVGYNPVVLQKIRKMHRKISEFLPVTTIICGIEGLEREKIEGKIVYLPFLKEDYQKYLAGSDIAVVKFGYQQILDAFAYGKPVITIGEGGFLLHTPDLLDESLQKLIIFDPELDNRKTIDFIDKLYHDKNFRKAELEKIRAIDNGSIDGATVVYNEIIKILDSLTRNQRKKTKTEKVAVFVLNSEIDQFKNQIVSIKGEKYVTQFIMPDITDVIMKKKPDEALLEKPLKDLIDDHREEILPHSFRDVWIFSQRRYDGLSDIGNWYYFLIENIKNIFEKSDKVYATPGADRYLKNIIKGKSNYEVIK